MRVCETMGRDKKGTREVNLMATQLAETPTLSGEDARAVWEDLQRPIDPAKVEKLHQQIRAATRDVKKGRPE